MTRLSLTLVKPNYFNVMGQCSIMCFVDASILV